MIIDSAHPTPLFVTPGKHHFVFAREGYITERHALDAVASDTATWDIHLKHATPLLSSPPAASRNTIRGVSAQPAPSTLLAIGGGLAAAAGVVGGVLLTSPETGTKGSPVGTTILLGSIGLSLGTSVTWQIWSEAVVRSEAQRSYPTRIWIAGQSPGDPGGAKVGVVSALHAASFTALGLGIWRYLEYRSAATGIEQAGTQDLCRTDTAWSAACLAWREHTREADNDRKLGLGLVTGAALLHLAALMSAEWWPNVTPSVGSAGGTATLRRSY